MHDTLSGYAPNIMLYLICNISKKWGGGSCGAGGVGKSECGEPRIKRND